MNININGIDFWDGFDAQKYWSIPRSHSPQQAHEEIKACMLSGNYIGSQKRDGIWAMVIKDEEGDFHLRSRTRNVNDTFADKAEWIPHIVESLKLIPNGTVVLGELYKPNDEGSRKVTSILNCLKEKSLERQKENPLSFYIFDCLAYAGEILINKGISERIVYFDKLFASTGEYVEYAHYVEGRPLWDLCGELLSAGYEGVVIQKKSARYLCGKRKAWDSIKVKKEISQTIDAFLDGGYKPPTHLYAGGLPETWMFWENEKTGEKVHENKFFEAGNGEPWVAVSKAYYYGWASAVSFSLMKDGKPYHLGYISGIPDQMKEEIITKNDEYTGRVYELSAMEVEKRKDPNGKVIYSLRHGKIVQERKDKNQNDCDFSQII